MTANSTDVNMALCWMYRCCCSQRRAGQEVLPPRTGRSPLPGGVAAAAKLWKSLAPEGEFHIHWIYFKRRIPRVAGVP
jgi:hypothetical protein